jgi:ABC-2 type transport system permease protein
MSNLRQAVYVETLKARRSRVSLFTALGIALLPLAGGFFMFVLKDPELARRVGLISAKANLLVATADWPSYLGFLAQALAGGGIVLFGLVAGWVFGREYSDRTAKDLLALPTSRSVIVLSKFVVVAAWCAALTVVVCLVGLGIGAAIGFPDVSTQVVLRGFGVLALIACMVIALVTPIAFFASAGHGYLAPMGVVFLIMLLAQVIAAAGWGEYFPWSIPGMYSQGEELGPASYAIVVVTCLAGIAGTLVWWERADQSR